MSSDGKDKTTDYLSPRFVPFVLNKLQPNGHLAREIEKKRREHKQVGIAMPVVQLSDAQLNYLHNPNVPHYYETVVANLEDRYERERRRKKDQWDNSDLAEQISIDFYNGIVEEEISTLASRSFNKRCAADIKMPM